jgi:hypothetical protein
VAQRAAEHCKALALELNEAREEVARLRARGAAPADRLNRANPATVLAPRPPHPVARAPARRLTRALTAGRQVLPRWCHKQVSELEAERRWRTCRVRFDSDAPPADVAPLSAPRPHPALDPARQRARRRRLTRGGGVAAGAGRGASGTTGFCWSRRRRTWLRFASRLRVPGPCLHLRCHST